MTLVLALLVGVVSARAQTPVTECGQTLTDGVLMNDVDCSGSPYGLIILHRGSLNLGGFTLTGGDGSAISCEKDCSVTGPGTITGAAYYGVASAEGRVTVNGATITDNDRAGVVGKHVSVQGCTLEFNKVAGISASKRMSATNSQFLHNRTAIHGIDFTRADVTDSSFVENEIAIAVGGRVTITGSSVVDSLHAGVLGRNVKATNLTATGNGTTSFCLYECVDVGAYRLRARNVTCDTSAVYSWPEFSQTGGTWGVCSQD